MFDNETAEGAERPETGSEETGSQNQLKSEIETLRKQNEELLNKFNSFFQQTQAKQEEKKALPPEDFKKLLDSNPQEAIEVALSRNIEMKTREIENKLTATQQTQYWDTKAEQDFPLLNKDKSFMEVVKREVKQLVDDGMDAKSPKLVYKAAEIAALKHKGVDGAKKEASGTISGEAPNTVKKGSDGKHLPKNFDRLSKMFGLSEKAKEKVKENFALRAEAEQRRGRRY